MTKRPSNICLAVFLAVVWPGLGGAQTPTFARDIAPLIDSNCVPCHHQGGAGPFALTSYEDVRKHARQIKDVTQRGYMPPWLPDHQDHEFEGELRLTASQTKIISEWVEKGEAAGDLSQAPQPLSFNSGWMLGTPDVIVKASKPFRVPAEGSKGSDVFWNFIFLPKVAASHYVRAVEIQPSNPKLVHHANIVIDRTGSLTKPFAGMDVMVPRHPLDFDGHFLFYKPGSSAVAEPPGFAWRIDPLTTLILNTHLQPSGKPEWEQPTIGLYFTDQPPVHFPYLLELEDDNSLEIPAGAKNFVAHDEFKLPIDTKVLAIYPHAHYLGRQMEAWAVLPDGSRKQLINIPSWDPNWQGVYRYRQPVFLPAETVISMRYTYDNSSNNPRNPHHPPKRVLGGNRASDEMAHLWLQVMPANSRESRALYAEAWAQHELRKNPDNYAAQLTFGSLAMARFRPTEALTPFQKAVELKPADAIARNLYGSALSAVGRNSEALLEFQEAVKLQPGLANARLNLAQALMKAGRNKEAIAGLHEILADHPGDSAAQALLSRIGVP